MLSDSQWLRRFLRQGLRFDSITVAGAAPELELDLGSVPASRSPELASPGSPDVSRTIEVGRRTVKQESCLFSPTRP